jgi:parallel beta-helix repeat protein
MRKMSKKEKKKSWKERQRERQIKQQRAQEAYKVQSEREAKKKPRQWPKGKIFVAVFFLVLILGVYGAWQYTSSSTPSDDGSSVSTGVIYIWPDGQVSPETAPISNVDNNHYTFTADIYAPIVVGRDNIVIDGANHALQGTGELGSKGIDLTGRSSVTVKNLEISGFDYGVYLTSASDNVISHNYFTNNYCAIWITASSNDNSVSGNNVVNNEMWAIFMKESSNNVISENELTSHTNYTIYIRHSNYTTFSANYIADNNLGIYFYEASDNILYHNNFVNNRVPISSSGATNTFDNGNEGNYWSEYEELYPDAEELDGSGIWNMPYVIDENNQDNYPFIDPWNLD